MGRQDAEDYYLVLLEQAQQEKEQAQREKAALIESFQRMIEAGIPKEIIAQANKISVEALEKLLEDKY